MWCMSKPETDNPRRQTIGIPALTTLMLVILGAIASPISRAQQLRAESTAKSQAAQSQAEEWMQEGRYEEAKSAWIQLAKEHPEDTTIHMQLGIALAHLGEYSQAAVQYRLVLKTHPHQPDVVYNLGLAEFKQGHFAAAASAF